MSVYEQNGDWITMKDAARILNCSARTIRRRIDTGKIEARIEYQGKQSIRYVRRADILREAGTIQHREPQTEVVTRGATFGNPMTSIGQVKKVVTGLIWKMALIVAGIIIIGGVTTYYLVIGQGKSINSSIEGVKSDLSQGLSQVKGDIVTGNKATSEELKLRIEGIRADTREENQITGDKINRQREDILRTGDQVEAQAAKIERQTVEIKELRTAIAGLQAGIEAIREEIIRPTPAPAATAPPEPEEKERGFLGIF